MLVPGPTAAIVKSAPGVWASPSSWATPPKSHSVTERTPTPWRRAITACEPSCASSDTKNSVAATTAATQ